LLDILALYRRVVVLAARRASAGWPAALSLILYALIFVPAALVTSRIPVVGGFLLAFVLAACWSSYLELISQVVAAGKIRLSWAELKRTFAARLWDVISVMFAFWILSFVTQQFVSGPHGIALSAIFGLAMAFFFNVVPELLYQGQTRSFSLLLDSGRFMFAHPVVWLLPNVVFAAVALWAIGDLREVHHLAEVLIAFGNTFSSPAGVARIFAGLPLWALPIALFVLHFVMVFRGILFAELSAGRGGNARLRAFQAASRR
jgi:hypothetical protein